VPVLNNGDLIVVGLLVLVCCRFEEYG